jgi:hypothetical protein
MRWKVITLAIYGLGLVYLLLPGPVIPNLEPAFKSTEPGDTWQLPGVWAYYTNLSRQEVVDFYKRAFRRSAWDGILLPIYWLNHPPEYANETIRDTHKTNFYEELVSWGRESLFVSGWIPKEDKVYLTKAVNPVTVFKVDGEEFTAKITLYHVVSPVWARISVWAALWGLVWGAKWLAKQLYR